MYAISDCYAFRIEYSYHLALKQLRLQAKVENC